MVDGNAAGAQDTGGPDVQGTLIDDGSAGVRVDGVQGRHTGLGITRITDETDRPARTVIYDRCVEGDRTICSAVIGLEKNQVARGAGSTRRQGAARDGDIDVIGIMRDEEARGAQRETAQVQRRIRPGHIERERVDRGITRQRNRPGVGIEAQVIGGGQSGGQRRGGRVGHARIAHGTNPSRGGVGRILAINDRPGSEDIIGQAAARGGSGDTIDGGKIHPGAGILLHAYVTHVTESHRRRAASWPRQRPEGEVDGLIGAPRPCRHVNIIMTFKESQRTQGLRIGELGAARITEGAAAHRDRGRVVDAVRHGREDVIVQRQRTIIDFNRAGQRQRTGVLKDEIAPGNLNGAGRGHGVGEIKGTGAGLIEENIPRESHARPVVHAGDEGRLTGRGIAHRPAEHRGRSRRALAIEGADELATPIEVKRTPAINRQERTSVEGVRATRRQHEHATVHRRRPGIILLAVKIERAAEILADADGAADARIYIQGLPSGDVEDAFRAAEGENRDRNGGARAGTDGENTTTGNRQSRGSHARKAAEVDRARRTADQFHGVDGLIDHDRVRRARLGLVTRRGGRRENIRRRGIARIGTQSRRRRVGGKLRAINKGTSQ